MLFVLKTPQEGRLRAMTKGRDNAAESLGDVLELIRMRRQSVLLSVERFQNSRFEEGEIYFQSGQPTYAHTGQMSGQEALVWLLSWHQVYYTFIIDEPRPSTNIPSAITAKESVAVASDLPTAPSRSFPRNTATYGNSPTFSSISPRVSTNTIPNRERTPEYVYPQSIQGGNASAVRGGTPGLEWLVPQKLGKEQDVLSLPLTRPQRSIYLLVDGRRTISDLSRCTRKSLPELQRLLSELQERGLITIQ
ncbi:MAG: hypothetical protein NVSMB27_32900 [Ktedonobacteraceae bacterium]